MLPRDEFMDLVKNAPLIAIDLVVYNPHGEVLIGMRTNQPAQNFWFVPGGRIYKNESIEEAFCRIAITELSVPLEYASARFLGVYQHIYTENFADDPQFGTHYVVIAFEVKLGEPISELRVDQQHQTYQWMAVDELAARPDVHPNTQNYFSQKSLISAGGGKAAIHSPIHS
jgi:colanic acid biosynthesis protein WcaH